MDLIHGTWIPDETEDFVQAGGFYLWVECDAATGQSARRGAGSIHPRGLAGPALATFLGEKLGIQDEYGGKLSRDIRPIFSRNCFPCHGQDAAHRATKMRLDRRESAVKQQKDGNTPIVPGSPTRKKTGGMCRCQVGKPVATSRSRPRLLKRSA